MDPERHKDDGSYESRKTNVLECFKNEIAFQDQLEKRLVYGSYARRSKKVFEPFTNKSVFRIQSEKKNVCESNAGRRTNDTDPLVICPGEKTDIIVTLQSRLATFGKWPLHSITPIHALAEAGFRSVDAAKQTCRCDQCGLIICARELGERRPITVHQQKSPNCHFIKNVEGIIRGVNIESVSPENLSSQLENSLHIDAPSFSHTDRLQELNNDSGYAHRDSASGQTRVNEIKGIQRNPEGARNEDQIQVTEPSPIPSYNPRNPYMVQEQARRESFRYWPHQSQMDIDLVVEAGFFFTGTEDIVRCFYCDIGLAEWNNDDDPWVEHARHSPDCPFLIEKKSHQYVNEIQQEWSRVYTPKRPELTQIKYRLLTFEDRSWPRDQVSQTPREIAEAGFYYIGEGDTVRCHYCDGGLREWEPNDDPWVEHARWFPFCKFVLKVKGIQFIQNSASGTQITETRPPEAAPEVQNGQNGVSTSYEEECRKKEQKNPLFTAAAQSIKEMGYSKGAIKMAINVYIGQKGQRDFEATDLLNIIFAKEETGELPLAEDDEFAVSGSNDSSDEEMELSKEALQKENEYLTKKMICIICKSKERCMVFLPCGHRLSCETCSGKTEKCNHCSSHVDRSIKTFLS